VTVNTVDREVAGIPAFADGLKHMVGPVVTGAAGQAAIGDVLRYQVGGVGIRGGVHGGVAPGAILCRRSHQEKALVMVCFMSGERSVAVGTVTCLRIRISADGVIDNLQNDSRVKRQGFAAVAGGAGPAPVEMLGHDIVGMALGTGAGISKDIVMLRGVAAGPCHIGVTVVAEHNLADRPPARGNRFLHLGAGTVVADGTIKRTIGVLKCRSILVFSIYIGRVAICAQCLRHISFIVLLLVTQERMTAAAIVPVPEEFFGTSERSGWIVVTTAA
jgi:hypothetical protein